MWSDTFPWGVGTEWVKKSRAPERQRQREFELVYKYNI
jgi:hypothetical protein